MWYLDPPVPVKSWYQTWSVFIVLSGTVQSLIKYKKKLSNVVRFRLTSAFFSQIRPIRQRFFLYLIKPHIVSDRAMKTDHVCHQDLTGIGGSKYRKNVIFHMKFQNLVHPYPELQNRNRDQKRWSRRSLHWRRCVHIRLLTQIAHFASQTHILKIRFQLSLSDHNCANIFRDKSLILIYSLNSSPILFKWDHFFLDSKILLKTYWKKYVFSSSLVQKNKKKSYLDTNFANSKVVYFI